MASHMAIKLVGAGIRNPDGARKRSQLRPGRHSLVSVASPGQTQASDLSACSYVSCCLRFPHAGDVAIKVQGDFTWDPDKPPTLTGLNLSFTKGQLVAVVGPTGSGKTSLM